MLETLAIDTLVEMEYLDLGTLILSEIVGLESLQDIVIAVVDGHEDDLLGIVVQPRLETLGEDLGRLQECTHDRDILGGELGIVNDGVRLVSGIVVG